MSEEQLKQLIQTDQTAISQIGNDLQRLKESVERLWKRVDEIKGTQLRDIKDQWEMIRELTQKVEAMSNAKD